MHFTKQQLLARLKELHINFSQNEHPAILTVQEGEKYVGLLGGGPSKSLFLKDKKQRFYLVYALKNTKVDIKALCQRLGLGKGGLRMAPSEALGEILQVPLGCVTPFSVMNESASKSCQYICQWEKYNGESRQQSSSGNYSDVELFVEEILHKTLRLLLSEIKEDSIKQHGENLGALISENLRKGLRSDLRNLAMIFKNTSYTEGFHAGTKHQSGRL